MGTNTNVMEVIWEMAQKGEDGALHYPAAFIDFLWENCFVDTKKFPLEVWRAAFEPFKQADGTYRLNREEFLSLDKYRFTGEVKIPFDANKIKEGKYTDEGFQKLIDLSIEPSCALNTEALKAFVDEIKNDFRGEDDLILIKQSAKQKIKKLLEDYPSPLRKLELMFDELLASTKETSQKASPQNLAQLQKSTFVSGAAHIVEEKSGHLKQLTKSKEKEALNTQNTLHLKKIKRSKKGLHV